MNLNAESVENHYLNFYIQDTISNCHLDKLEELWIKWICIVGKRFKLKESKNTNEKIENIVNRDYDNKFRSQHIIAIDVTYITALKDISQNHIYLSVSISHETKEVLL